ncbi:hypothetical protein DL239_06780 [Sedimentitalea sp. CY04]|uniref:Transposase n=1 Tax=Parasedimentitalea denitrificans TaxID=2211118 RepID=A0ABX0W5X8_9RHOB|nr:hypothetical protein [Sedimentitalea sp. CY04]
MPTYQEVQSVTKKRFGFTPKSCWIAHLKSEHSLTRGAAPNRQSLDSRKHPCPDHRRDDLTTVLIDMGVLPRGT